MDLQDSLQGLQRELKNRKETGSSCAWSPIKESSSICKKMAIVLSKTPKPSGGRGCSFPTRGRSRGLPPSPSARINNSMSGGIPVSRGTGRTNVPTMVSAKAASTRPIDGRASDSSRNHHIPAGVTQSKVVGQGGMQLIGNSSKPSSGPALGHGRNAAAALPKVPSKRKRASKKLPFECIHATPTEFRAIVQEFTGFKDPPIPVGVRPQPERPRPERPQGDAVPINFGLDSCEDPPVRVDSSSTSMIIAVHSPPSTPVSDRVPEAPFFMPDSSCDSSSLNDCMGYGLNTPRFLELSYDENLGQLPDSIQAASSEYDCHISVHMQHKKREGSTTTASPITASVEEVAVLLSEGNGREGIPREQACSGSHFDSGYLHHVSRQSSFLVLDNRNEESDPDDETLTRMANSFLNDYQSDFQ